VQRSEGGKADPGDAAGEGVGEPFDPAQRDEGLADGVGGVAGHRLLKPEGGEWDGCGALVDGDELGGEVVGVADGGGGGAARGGGAWRGRRRRGR